MKKVPTPQGYEIRDDDGNLLETWIREAFGKWVVTTETADPYDPDFGGAGPAGPAGPVGPAGAAGDDASTPFDVSVFGPGGGEIQRVTGTHFLTDIAPSLYVLSYILGSAGGITNGTTLEIVFVGSGIATISLQGSTGFNDIVGDGGSGKTLTSNNVTGDTVRLVAHDNTWFITKLKGFVVSA